MEIRQTAADVHPRAVAREDAKLPKNQRFQGILRLLSRPAERYHGVAALLDHV
ncbi:hypothetical protein I553_0173 [Mycobacterium xenopi 4042]|uniref:Uncharacterized protein n=1 Tax=Mycobacterium xenopi 4042 TaxID=1299334 RepID=X7YIQ5_MYCXE|nr:hypothetical protein I553_0173 [Mycobacterium xenopi 4042]